MDNMMLINKIQWDILDPNSKQTQHFCLKFYATNIIFLYIYMKTWQNFNCL